MLGLGVEHLDSLLYIDTLVGGMVPFDRVCRNCEFMIGDHRLVIDLIILDMSTFDVILGMD